MRMPLAAALVVACALTTRTADAQSIGVFPNPDATTHLIYQPAPAAGVVYVLIILGGEASAGILGAEFRVECFPRDWPASWEPNPSSSSRGNLLGSGVQIGFESCQGGTRDVVLLYRVDYFATYVVQDYCLSVNSHVRPSNPNFPCPLLVLCDAPTYTSICVRSSIGILNGSWHVPCSPADCSVAVEPATWSSLKRLYR